MHGCSPLTEHACTHTHERRLTQCLRGSQKHYIALTFHNHLKTTNCDPCCAKRIAFSSAHSFLLESGIIVLCLVRRGNQWAWHLSSLPPLAFSFLSSNCSLKVLCHIVSGRRACCYSTSFSCRIQLKSKTLWLCLQKLFNFTTETETFPHTTFRLAYILLKNNSICPCSIYNLICLCFPGTYSGFLFVFCSVFKKSEGHMNLLPSFIIYC